MDSLEIRQKFIEFYQKKNHSVIPSVSLIPENDPTLLFVNSGMFPLVNYLLGEKHPQGEKLVNFQRCFRTDDIEEVGDHRHTTFFEMLGNWSLGEYFKKEQLSWWFEFLFETIKLDPNKIYQTVYAGDSLVEKDQESIEVLKKAYSKYGITALEGPETRTQGEKGPGVEVDFNQHRVFAYRDKNWWQRGDALGELGGPDSETFYDTGKKHDPSFGEFCHLNCDCGRFLEIGNSVFIQYQKTENGWQEIKNKNVDFGGGLERIAMVVNNFDNIYQTDLFQDIILEIENLSGKKYKDNHQAFEIISDHVKASVFIIGDQRGVVPSNKHQGYFARRLIRRAVRYGRKIGITSDDWMKVLASRVIEKYSSLYPELKENSQRVLNELEKEQNLFEKTLEKGLKEFNKMEGKTISGQSASILYQTYGFPIEMIEELAQERNLEVDREGFFKELEQHKEMSRTASAGVFKSGLLDQGEKTTKLHTATHLLLSSLKKVLGDQIVQRGSNITSDRLRFDFSFQRKLTEQEIKEVQEIVNKKIKEDLEVFKKEMKLDEALNSGATGCFGEKYPEKVNVYQIGDKEVFSREICHGPHVKKTSEIGSFKIVKEEACSSGVRRIKAVID
jgi:alanyl-tRNA synthetase